MKGNPFSLLLLYSFQGLLFLQKFVMQIYHANFNSRQFTPPVKERLFWYIFFVMYNRFFPTINLVKNNHSVETKEKGL